MMLGENCTWGHTSWTTCCLVQRAGLVQGDDATEPSPQIRSRAPLVLGASITQAPLMFPRPWGAVRTLWASWARNAVHGDAQRKAGTFPVHQEMAVFSPRCRVSEKPPPSMVCPGRGLDPHPRGPGPSTGPGECSPSSTLCLGVKHHAAQVQGPQATKRRSCPGLEQALWPSMVHSVMAPVRKAGGSSRQGVAPKTHGALPRFPGMQRDRLMLDTRKMAGQAHSVQTGASEGGPCRATA